MKAKSKNQASGVSFEASAQRATDQSACCHLCAQIEGISERDLIASFLGGPYERRVITETDSFAVIPSLGPLTPGHVLLCPKVHYKSFAQLPGETETECKLIKDIVTAALKKAYNLPIHCFEHGMGTYSTRVVCSTDHGHLHFIPAGVDIESVLGDNLPWQRVELGPGELKKAAGSREYLFYESPAYQKFIATGETGSFKSQFMRQLFAERLGIKDDWNWKDKLKLNMVESTFNLLKEAFENTALVERL